MYPVLSIEKNWYRLNFNFNISSPFQALGPRPDVISHDATRIIPQPVYHSTMRRDELLDSEEDSVVYTNIV